MKENEAKEIEKPAATAVNVQRLVMPEPDQMCCYLCGHIAKINDSFDCVPGDDDPKEFPVCPKCEGYNCGGYPSYAIADVWPEEMLSEIVKINSEV